MAEADRWLEWAAEDIELADYALSRAIRRQVCFHAQQAVEKALKGMLESRRGEHPRAHSLEALLLHDPAICAELARWRETWFLDVFYAVTRYPDALPGLGPEGEPSTEDAERALREAKAILGDVRARMGKGT
ncbi:MAG TPA: HEPN domain-containing protein [Methylomirabilota bacterium]|jgi:HEPN domain-containing protein|nr:HEPN domain-containing protein [Methylomirabilota bacterium]